MLVKLDDFEQFCGHTIKPKMTILDFRQKKTTVILSMLGVKFQQNKNIMFLVCNKGIFSREER